MKQLFIITLMLLSSSVYAADEVCSEYNIDEEITQTKEINTDVPKHLQGAVIIVRQADGKESIVPAEKFKVVPRKQQYLVTKTEKSKVLSCNKVTNEPKKNRVSLLGGYGAKEGLSASSNGSAVNVESKVGFVGGAQYQHMLSEKLSIGVQGQSNKTGSLLFGVDF